MEKSIEALQAHVKEFCDKRDWEQFHNIRHLVSGLCIEAAELSELFLWKDDAGANKVVEEKREAVQDELADTFYYILRISELYGINLTDAVEKKLAKNDAKYPAEKVKGKDSKYTEY